METKVRDIVVGSILGDGWLDAFESNTGTSRFRLKCNDKAIGYLDWVREKLIALDPCELKPVSKYNQHYFYTKARKDIGDLRRIFYPGEGVKRVPVNIGDLLTKPISLAIWYQDDGNLDNRFKYHHNAMLATYCFPYDDCVKLKETLRQNFNIEVSVCKCRMRGKMYYRLYVLSRSMNLFIETIRPYVHKDFAYKIA